MKLFLVLLLCLVACSSLAQTESSVEVQAERIEAVASRVESGKLTDKQEIADEIRSCKGMLLANHEALALCRKDNERLRKEVQELAEQAGRGAMITWLYWAVIGAFVLWNLIGFLRKRGMV